MGSRDQQKHFRLPQLEVSIAMSKNTRSAEFRKVDVDELDDEQYRDDPEEVADSDDSKVQQREQEIKKLMQSYPSFE